MNTVKKLAPWLVSAAVHGGLLALALVILTGVEPTAPESAMAEDAGYSVTIRPGGGPTIDQLSKDDTREFGVPTTAAPTFDETPREPAEDLKLVSPQNRAPGREYVESAPTAHLPSPASRSGGRVRLDPSVNGGGSTQAIPTPGSGSGTGVGVGDGPDEGVQAQAQETPSPKYPEEARRSHAQGTVVIDIRIDKSGNVESARVTESSGHSILDDAAVAAVRTWTYRPATLKGSPVASIRRVRLVFRLE